MAFGGASERGLWPTAFKRPSHKLLDSCINARDFWGLHYLPTKDASSVPCSILLLAFFFVTFFWGGCICLYHNPEFLLVSTLLSSCSQPCVSVFLPVSFHFQFPSGSVSPLLPPMAPSLPFDLNRHSHLNTGI